MATKKLILCDTNVLISAFREEESVLAEFDRLGFGGCGLASVTVAEIYFGMRKDFDFLPGVRFYNPAG